MRESELNKMKILEFFTTHDKLPLNSKNIDKYSYPSDAPTIYSLLEIYFDSKTKQYVSPDHQISYKTVNRYIDELTSDEILIKDNIFYSLNKNELVVPSESNSQKWKKILEAALSCGELEIYCKFKKYLNVSEQRDFLNEYEIHNYKNCIKDNINLLNSNQIIIHKIKKAIDEKCQISITYKGKVSTVYPLCIVISRDGKRHYLYGVKRNRIEPPFELSQVSNIILAEKKEIDTTPFIDNISKLWDVDLTFEEKVTVLLRKEYDEDFNIYKELKSYFGSPYKTEKQTAYFSGPVYGINNFKAYIREHLDCCIILEPQNIQNELIKSLEEKIRRYNN